MVQNGYYLPSEKSSFCTMRFMQEVRSKVCFCPRLGDMTFKACTNPPTNTALIDFIANMIETNDTYPNDGEANRYKRLAVHIKRNPPEKQWMLGLLSTLMPENEIF